MNQVVSRIRPRQTRQTVLGILLLFVLMLVAACSGGGGDESAPETAVQQTGSLTCSQTCLSQGQCGAAVDGSIIILAHSGQPTLRNHDTLLANEAAVTIIGQQTLSISDAAGTISSMNFFNVQSEGGPASWVSGSCINTQ